MKWNQETAVDIFFTWPTVTLVTIGATLDMVSLGGFNSAGFIFLAGLGMMGAGIAYGCQRFFTEGEAIALKQVERAKRLKIEKDELRLNALATRIRNDGDDGYGQRSRQVLKNLRALKKAFDDHVSDTQVTNFVTSQFQSNFVKLYWHSIESLERASKLLETSRSMTNNTGILQTRHRMIEDVEEKLVSLTTSFEGLTTLALTHDTDGLDNVQRDLEAQLQTARAVERELSGGIYDISQDSEMKDYLQ